MSDNTRQKRSPPGVIAFAVIIWGNVFLLMFSKVMQQ